MQDTTSEPIEVWRPVVGYEMFYEVSDLGRVRSFTRTTPGRFGSTRTVTGRVLKPMIDDGYVRYTFCFGKGTRPRVVRGHILVAATFLGPRPPGHDVRHLDGDRTNNRLANLAYGTRSENVRDSARHGTHNWPHVNAAAARAAS